MHRDEFSKIRHSYSMCMCMCKAWGMTELSPGAAVTPDGPLDSMADLNGTSGPLLASTEAKVAVSYIIFCILRLSVCMYALFLTIHMVDCPGVDLDYTSEGEVRRG